MIIGLTGVMGAGKTYTAEKMKYVLESEYFLGYREHFLEYRLNARICSISTPIKEITLKLFPEWGHEHIDGKLKNLVSHDTNISPRRVMQIVGKNLLEIKQTLWIDMLFQRLDTEGVNYDDRLLGSKDESEDNWVIIIDDVRFPHDFKAIKDKGGFMIGVKPIDAVRNRIIQGLDEEMQSHKSESYINELVSKSDLVLVNNYDKKYDDIILDVFTQLIIGKK